MELFEKAKQLYAEKNLDFEQDLLTYTRFGYVYVTPSCIILAEVQNDCWFIQFALGENSIKEFLRIMPFPLTYVSWRRGLRPGNNLVKLPIKRIISICK